MAEMPSEEDFWREELERFLPDVRKALEEALGYVCCPICQVLAGVPFAYFALLPRRWVDEERLREVVCWARGFCARHAWRMFEMQSLVAVARVYVDVLDAAPTAPTPPSGCPVCRLQGLMEPLLVEGFSHWLARPVAHDLYCELQGLCYPHLEQLLQLGVSDGVKELVVRCQEARREELVRDLRGYLEKDTIEAKWTRTEAENRAPRRALLKLSGSDES